MYSNVAHAPEIVLGLWNVCAFISRAVGSHMTCMMLHVPCVMLHVV